MNIDDIVNHCICFVADYLLKLILQIIIDFKVLNNNYAFINKKVTIFNLIDN